MLYTYIDRTHHRVRYLRQNSTLLVFLNNDAAVAFIVLRPHQNVTLFKENLSPVINKQTLRSSR